MRITVQLTTQATEQMRKARGAKRGVLDWLHQRLTPIHTTTDDPELASFYEIVIDDPNEATRLLKRLQADAAVRGAYIKPDDELPSP
jgi:hypothetical protein